MTSELISQPSGDPAPADVRGRLKRALEQNRRLHQESGDVDADDLRALQEWQSERLRASYEEFTRDPGYAPATRFFFEDLYGPKDFSQRDADVERIYPGLVRVLPEGLLHSMTAAIELNVMSAQFDRDMVASLNKQGVPCESIDAESYARAYLDVGRLDQRKEQLIRLDRLGRDLQGAVRKRLLVLALRAARLPARIAGLDQLQRFLERGLEAFQAMPDPSRFVGAVVQREGKFIESMELRQ